MTMIGVPICDKATRENINVAITRLPKFDRSLKHRRIISIYLTTWQIG